MWGKLPTLIDGLAFFNMAALVKAVPLRRISIYKLQTLVTEHRILQSY